MVVGVCGVGGGVIGCKGYYVEIIEWLIKWCILLLLYLLSILVYVLCDCVYYYICIKIYNYIIWICLVIFIYFIYRFYRYVFVKWLVYLYDCVNCDCYKFEIEGLIIVCVFKKIL